MKSHTPKLIALSFAIASAAPAVEIVVTADPPGPLMVGQEVTINLGVRGWNPADPEVDAVAFNMDFDPDMLQFVTGSGELVKGGTEFLALPNQGVDYALDDDSDESLIDYGRFIVGCTDIGDASAGSIGPDGKIGSFVLRAVAPGTTRVQSSSNSPKAVFFDPQYYGIAPTGGIDMGAVNVTVSPDPVTYARWAATIPWANQGDARPGADPERDGRQNLLEYFFNANPLAFDPEHDPQLGSVIVQGREFNTLVYQRPAGALTRSDTKDQGQRSEDAEVWDEDVVVESVGPIDVNTGKETVVLRSAHAVGRFDVELLRLLVDLDSVVVVGP